MKERQIKIRLWWQKTGLLILTILMGMMLTRPAQAASGDNYNINISGTLDYDKGLSLLSEINELRTDTTALSMDATLMQSAMKRAEEIACVYNNWLRPDNSDALSIDSRAAESTILFNKKTVAKALAALKKNSTYKKAMLNTDYHSVGVGCFTIGGYTFWCLLYSTDTSGDFSGYSTVTRTVTVNVTEYSSTLKAGINGNLGDAISLYARNTCEVTPIWVNRSSGLSRQVSFQTEVSSYRFSSSNEAVATVDAKGVVTTLSSGTAVIRAVPKVSTGTVTGVSVKVKVLKNKIKAALNEESYVYTGAEIKPEVKVTKGKKTLKADTDYTVAYADNLKPGIATLTITGQGTYASQSIILQFAILPQTPTVTVSTTDDQLTATWKKVPRISGYQIQIATNKKMTKNVYTKSFSYKTRTFTMDELSSGTKYYVRVRAYKKTSSGRLYGSWSQIKKITIASS